MIIRLALSIGPVQGFVSQSRRTRDLWGSSWLLAFLSAHAMRGAVTAGGRLIRPDVRVVERDRLYRWVSGHRDGDPPRIGSLPNHFVVEVDGAAPASVPDVAHAATRSLHAAWERVCVAVWRTFVQPACRDGEGTEAIWNRQVRRFWEIMWITAETELEVEAGPAGGPLARRKRWRSHYPPEEPGDKCTVMHDWQELSGFVRAWDAVSQDRFWRRIRESIPGSPVSGAGALDLRDNERLCAVALVKRLFPYVAQEAVGWEMDVSRWPSTVYVGAVPWIRRVVSAVPEQASGYAEAVGKSTGNRVFPMQSPPFHSLNSPAAGAFQRLDANFLHREFVASERQWPWPGESIPAIREDLVNRLGCIYESVGAQGSRLGPPPTHYALLLADGDRLGLLATELGGAAVSNALDAFTRKAPEVVREHDGVAVYAGGDDVLALLPTPQALSCARILSDTYRAAFADEGVEGKIEATLSAAVVFAQVRLPLGHVLREAHRLLDAVAKEGNGRDSLAAAVLKSGGTHCEWVSAWTRPHPEGGTCAVDRLRDLVRQLDVGGAEPGLSGALVYRIRDLLARLCAWERWRPGPLCQHR